MIKKMYIELTVDLNEEVVVGKTLEKHLSLSDLLPGGYARCNRRAFLWDGGDN